ncbi:MAG TPA: DUF5916 domain-containing protein [Bacteroidales bacterium]|nr:DUF5916 domain-containing protein [Bacteroidales bacterium]HSA42448.1 DUF5916 domain-containing protein [Bacteroidales bacterium]
MTIFLSGPLLPQQQVIPEPASKTVHAARTERAPRIDGLLTDTCWQLASVAGDFVEYSPRNGGIPPFRTEVRFLYNDEALFVGVMMYDPFPDSIDRELGRRDELESLNSDRFSVDIIPYNDGLNMYEFKVGPSGVQNDVKYTAIGQDPFWDAVWECRTSIVDSGWIAEFRIPFSALRFPSTPMQTWGINMWRNVNRRNEWSTWCYVDNKTDNIFRYYGEITDIKDIRPPFRLSLYPYAATYAEKNPGQKKWSYLAKGGLDLKMGLSDSYTLDMVLVPDFGQVQSDEEILNLSPFEVQYDEKRQFFTEGTELFNKCNIFYSRRIGMNPLGFSGVYQQLEKNEVVVENPEETRLINATKLSGRGKDGLGLGLFNAMTADTRAEVKDTITGKERKILTQPFTNYNVLVLDQNLPNNSYLSLINTNLSIPSEKYAANVSGVESRLYNKRNTLEWIGQVVLSQKYSRQTDPSFGHRMFFYIGKPSGKYQYYIYRDQTDRNYDPNDLGYLSHNNMVYNKIQFIRLIANPTRTFINSKSQIAAGYNNRYHDNRFSDLFIDVTNSTTWNSYWYTYISVRSHPSGFNDFYEPRLSGAWYHAPVSHSFVWQVSSDTRKRFQGVFSVNMKYSPANHNDVIQLVFDPRFRVSDRLSISLSSMVDREVNNYGWTGTLSEEPGDKPSVIFARRDVSTVSNSLLVKVIFNPLSSISCKLRHYWSKAVNLDYHFLKNDGSLTPFQYDSPDINFRIFTLDLQYTWNFAPGSELSIVWKNSMRSEGSVADDYYWDSLENTFRLPQANSISLKAIYYLDYNTLKPARKKAGFSAGSEPKE